MPWSKALTVVVGLSGYAGACGVIPAPLLDLTFRAEQAYGLPKHVLVSLVWAESRYCVRAVSEAGAQGLGQLMPGTAQELGVRNPFDPAQNLYGAARYLRRQWDTFKNWQLALLAYHDGPGNTMAGRHSQRGLNYAAFVLGTYQAIEAQGGLKVVAP